MQTIAIFNTRGGSGKSAVTVFLADFLSTVFKKRVLVVDLDPQQSSSVALLGEERLYEGFGRKKSLPPILERALREDLLPNAILYSAIERPKYRGRKGTVYLAPIHVLACERESWHDLHLTLTSISPSRQASSYGLLSSLLHKVSADFDVCLIDFPGHETGPITKNGLRAANWWLFPCVPDRAGIRDIEGPVTAIKDAYKGEKRQMQGLGTLLSVSQPATSLEYRQAAQTLREAAEKAIIPKLFSDKARMLIWTGARNALDDTLWGDSTTLAQKYKEEPLFNAAKALCHDALQRMEMPYDEVILDFTLIDGLNGMLRYIFVKSKA